VTPSAKPAVEASEAINSTITNIVIAAIVSTAAVTIALILVRRHRSRILLQLQDEESEDVQVQLAQGSLPPIAGHGGARGACS
jgi:hypothetical protein